MLDRAKLELLRRAVADDDVTAAADICLELSLESKGTTHEFYVEELAGAVRRKDTEWLEFIIDQLVAN